MTSSTPWFRFYSEALSDRKITRVCAITRQPKYAILGMWAGLLSMANDSPERGVLLIGGDLPLTLEEIFYELGFDPETGQRIIEAFIEVGMVSVDDDIYSITNWDARQFASDSSNDRVKAYRERQRAKKRQAVETGNDSGAEDETAYNPTEVDDSNVSEAESDGYGKRYSVTEVKRYSNVIDTESDTESTSNEVTEKSVGPPDQSSRIKRSTEKNGLPTGEELLQADTPLKQIMGMFLVKTGYKLPAKKNNRDFWWSEIRELYNIAESDTGRAQKLVELTVERMKAEKLSIASPKSIVGTAQQIATELTNNGHHVVASYGGY